MELSIVRNNNFTETEIVTSSEYANQVEFENYTEILLGATVEISDTTQINNMCIEPYDNNITEDDKVNSSQDSETDESESSESSENSTSSLSGFSGSDFGTNDTCGGHSDDWYHPFSCSLSDSEDLYCKDGLLCNNKDLNHRKRLRHPYHPDFSDIEWCGFKFGMSCTMRKRLHRKECMHPDDSEHDLDSNLNYADKRGSKYQKSRYKKSTRLHRKVITYTSDSDDVNTQNCASCYNKHLKNQEQLKQDKRQSDNDDTDDKIIHFDFGSNDGCKRKRSIGRTTLHKRFVFDDSVTYDGSSDNYSTTSSDQCNMYDSDCIAKRKKKIMTKTERRKQ